MMLQAKVSLYPARDETIEIPRYHVAGNHEAIIPPSTIDRVQKLLAQV